MAVAPTRFCCDTNRRRARGVSRLATPTKRVARRSRAHSPPWAQNQGLLLRRARGVQRVRPRRARRTHPLPGRVAGALWRVEEESTFETNLRPRVFDLRSRVVAFDLMVRRVTVDMVYEDSASVPVWSLMARDGMTPRVRAATSTRRLTLPVQRNQY